MIAQLNEKTAELFAPVMPNAVMNYVSVGYIRAFGDYVEEGSSIKATGVILYSMLHGSPCILWHFVDEKYRGNGIGETLINKVINENPGAVSILFPTRYVTEDYFRYASKYYEELGFKYGDPKLSRFTDFLFLTREISEYEILAGIPYSNVNPLSSFTNSDVIRALSNVSAPPKEILSILGSKVIDRTLSCCHVDKKGKISGLLFASDADNCIDILSIINLASSAPMNVLKMLSFLMRQINASHSPGTRVRISAHKSSEKQIDALNALFPDALVRTPPIMIR